ncbi:MAG: ribonuclease P protein component [Dehalococcoidia bacterium]
MPAPERLRRSQDFAAAMRRGRRARLPLLTLVASRTDRPVTRAGFAVSRRVGGAVVRNRLKRRLRMAMRALPWRPGFDVVVVPQPECASARYEEVSGALEQAAHKLSLLNTDNH